MSTTSPRGGRTDVLYFVNRFTVHGDAAEFERAFSRTAEFLRGRPGLLEYTLLGDSDGEGQYMNIALWTDEASFRAAVGHPDFAQHAAAMRELSVGESGFYRLRQSFVPGIGEVDPSFQV